MSDWSNLEAEYEHFSTWKVENHKITQLHPHLTLCMSLNRQQLNVPFFKLPCLNQLLALSVNQSVSQICTIKLVFLLRQILSDAQKQISDEKVVRI